MCHALPVKPTDERRVSQATRIRLARLAVINPSRRAPFGFERSLRIFVDPNLLNLDAVWAASGTWNDVFPIAPDDLFRTSGGIVTELKRA